MARTSLLAALILCAALAAAAPAQVLVSRGGPPAPRRAAAPAMTTDLGGHGGVRWTWSQQTSVWDGTFWRPATIDLADSGFWGVSLDHPLRPGTWLELLYERQESDLVLRERATGEVLRVPATLNTYHLGLVQALRPGPVVPFTSLTFGVTSVRDEAAGVTDHHFGLTAGVGVKLHASRRLGLRLQARLPLIFTASGLGFGCSTAYGCGGSFGGTGVAQTDLSAGAFLRF